MADVEDTLPPAKRRHGWDAEGAGGTETPRIQVGDLGGLAETDFPVLDGELTAQKPTPTAGVITALKAQEALLRQRQPALKVGPQRSTTPEAAPQPEEAFRMMRDYIFYHWSDVEDTGMDYPILQHLAALQAAIELHVQQCEARDREATAEDSEGDMADVEDTMPPAKR